MDALTLRECPAHTAFTATGHMDPNAPSELLDRMPPANLEAEASLLCCLLLDSQRMKQVGKLLKREDFYDPFHAEVYQMLYVSWISGRPNFDAGLLLTSLVQQTMMDRTLAAGLIAGLMNREITPVHAEQYAEQVVAMAQRRRWLATAVGLLHRVWDEPNVVKVADYMAQAVNDFEADNRLTRAVRTLISVRLRDVEPEYLEWLWPGRIARGKLTLVAGDPGLGKSFLSLDLAARVSRGDVWPDNPNLRAPLGDVLLLNAEDGLADTVRPRLDAAGADVDRVVALTAVSDHGGSEQSFSLHRDLDLLLKELEARPETKLIIIDPITAYLGNTTGNNNTEVRSLLMPLAQLAQKYQVAVLAVTHLNKNSGGKAMYRAMGSLAFVAAARAAWGVVRDPADAERRMFLPLKNNLSQETKGLAYRLVSHPEHGAAHVGWFPEPIETAIDEILQASPAASQGQGEERRDAASVQAWLADVLSDGVLPAEEVRHLAKQEGITPDQLRRAEKLGVRRSKSGFLGNWEWTLPKAG